MDLKYCWTLCACKYDGAAYPVDLKVLREGSQWHDLIADVMVELAFAENDADLMSEVPTGYVVEVRFAKISVQNVELDKIEQLTIKKMAGAQA